MKIVKLFLVVVLAATINVAYGQNTIESLASSNARLSDAANGALEKADNILSSKIREAILAIFNLIPYVDQVLEDRIDDVDNKLTEKEVALLNEIKRLTSVLEEGGNNLAEQVDASTAEISNLLARTIFGTKNPAPLSYNIPILTTRQDKMWIIEIKGVQLNNPKNYIEFGNTKIPPISRASETNLIFSIPLTLNDTFNPKIVNTFKLVLFKSKGLGKNKPYSFTPRFIVFPQMIATVSVYYNVIKPTMQLKKALKDAVGATSGSNRTKDVHKTFYVKNRGWKIDRKSIVCRKVRGKGDKHGIGGPYDITDISFVAKAYAKNGKSVCECKWNEYKEGTEIEIQTSTTILFFNAQEVVLLPSNLSPTGLSKVVVSFSDGTQYTTFDPDFKHNSVAFSFNQLAKSYQVKFKP